jgi:predicted nucleic acid-binding protein
MSTIIDSNVLLDVLTDNAEWRDWSSQAITRAAESSMLVINAIIYAEVSVGFIGIEDVNDALPPDRFVREAIPFEAAFLAGKAYHSYRRRGGVRSSPLPDFFIGAHAAVKGHRLITRDATRFRTYFPKLDLITP